VNGRGGGVFKKDEIGQGGRGCSKKSVFGRTYLMDDPLSPTLSLIPHSILNNILLFLITYFPINKSDRDVTTVASPVPFRGTVRMLM